MPSGRTPGRRPSSNAAVSTSATASGTSCSGRFDRQEKLQQIVEKALPQIRRPDALVVAHDQSARLGLRERLFRKRNLQARALGERAHGKSFGQAQSVHHELERQIGAFDLAALLHRTALGDALEILLGLLPAHRARNAVAKGELTVGTRADAQVVAVTPVLEIVAGLPAGVGPSRVFVVEQTR